MYLFERAREHASGREGKEAEGERISSSLHAQHRAPLGTPSHDPMRSQPEPKSGVGCLTD